VVKRALWTVAAAALAGPGSVSAHHSISVIEISTPVWVKGTVARYEIANPHTMIELDVTNEAGQVERWIVEGPQIARIERMGVDANLLALGDEIEICGFHPKQAVSERRPPFAGPLPPWIHGHLILLPDGGLQPWGPYGKLDNCIRPGDDKAKWLRLLDTSAVAHALWCGPHNALAPTISDARALAAEIEESLAVPCPRRYR
jgi:hypothetical protein